VIDLRAAIEGGSAEEILRSTVSTLNTDQDNGLEPQIQIDESDSFDLLAVAADHIEHDNAVYDVEAGRYETCFTMNVSDVRADTRGPDQDIVVDFERLRDAGKVLADELGEELRTVSRGVQEVFSTDEAWTRPQVGAGAIGLGPDGPWKSWNEVRSHLVRILGTTAGQVVEIGEYLISAANYLERQDASAKEAMDNAAQELDNVFK
jgi:hypothetical protein